MAPNGTILLCHFRGFDSYLYVVACLVVDINDILQTLNGAESGATNPL